ncbi:hypothetical protein [Roseibacillus persicicus]|uniref:VWFA domain-containing protein n=1 Tax=Roseibacillus persicicus TaxID=454148 RepID=A0A918TI98_9BACT|nr:hypothetical protein [Roseibacillus persicicus]GHC47019.1 hypothetical protein GCM10007100_10920 [Roseibacillus persicicus]
MKVILRFVLVFCLVWAVLAGLAQFVRLAPDWPIWTVAVGVSLSVEAILGLYRYERSAVAPGRSRTLISLRFAALAVLVWILVEPTWVRTVTRDREQEIVVVLDDSASMDLQDEGEELTRGEIAEKVLADSGLMEKLEENFRVRQVRAARSVLAHNAKREDGWKQATDLAAALGSVLEQVPPDELGGVVLLSDGRHNRPAQVEETARRFGILDAPIGSVAIGRAEPPKDAAVLRVSAPEAIHLGDRMRVSAGLKFDGYSGQKAKVLLTRAGELLEEREISVPQKNHREEVRFVLTPEAGGVGDFRIEIAPLEGERFSDNNGWDFETSITDARTNVLLIDRHPRWEFRYLRNLFYGRDKSVHLQWLLLNPDRIEGEEPEKVPASAARPFGEAQATSLPVNEEEWRKFDVIILGDLSAADLDGETWAIINRCVSERAAMLVLVAGPESMPHALSPEARQLVPVEMEWGNATYYGTRSQPFRIGLGSSGVGHPVVKQSQGAVDDGAMWRSFPEMRWRHSVRSLKEGAEVLLVAEEGDTARQASAEGLRDALRDLANRRQKEAESALLVTRQTGRGKVALLLTDRTWRLREGSGDVYHHRFWGNLVRWGAGPILRSGSPQVRLGTDQLTYTPDDPVRLQARLREKDLAPVWDESLRAEVLRGGSVVATVDLSPFKDSNGLHEGVSGPFSQPGLYQVRLRGSELARLSPEEQITTGFRVVGSRGPIELADTTLNLPLLQTLADLSGGEVVSSTEIDSLASLFRRDEGEREEVRETSLWSQWPVLLLLFAILSAEWILRRGAGLP